MQKKIQCNVENALKLPWFCWMEIYRFDSLWSLSKFALIQTYKRVTWKNPIPNKDDKSKKRGRLVITLISSLRGCEQFKQKQKATQVSAEQKTKEIAPTTLFDWFTWYSRVHFKLIRNLERPVDQTCVSELRWKDLNAQQRDLPQGTNESRYNWKHTISST